MGIFLECEDCPAEQEAEARIEIWPNTNAQTCAFCRAEADCHALEGDAGTVWACPPCMRALYKALIAHYHDKWFLDILEGNV